jgi:hypothetical protein
MKWIGRLVLLLLAAVLVAGGVLAVHLLRSMPQLDGQLKLAGLSGPVTITRDAADVTHMKVPPFWILGVRWALFTRKNAAGNSNSTAA